MCQAILSPKPKKCFTCSSKFMMAWIHTSSA